MRTYFTYILASKKNGTLYTGVTNDIERRVYEHKHKLTPGFTSRYNVNRLVYYEEYNDIRDAIAREKQIKGWLRKKKIALIESTNPNWDDLSTGWYE
jgi:putative endonuclease